MDNHTPNVDEAEKEARSQTIARHSKEIRPIENLLNLFLEAARESGPLLIEEDNKRERLWTLLTARSFNSIKIAFDNLLNGYYAQPLILIRSAFEDWLVAFDAIDHPETVESLLNKDGSPPRFKEMSDRLPKSLKEGWGQTKDGPEGTYDILSTIGHPRYRAMAMGFNVQKRGVRLGPGYDEENFIFTAYYLQLAGVRMSEFWARLAPPEWSLEKLHPGVIEANKSIDRLTEQAKAMLEADE